MAGNENSGRKPLTPTPRQRELARLLAATRLARPKIAAALGISEDSLLRYFQRDLENAPMAVYGEILKAVYDAALAGNTRAMDMMLSLIDPRSRRQPLGKKQARLNEIDAVAARTGWADIIAN